MCQETLLPKPELLPTMNRRGEFPTFVFTAITQGADSPKQGEWEKPEAVLSS